MADMTSCTCIVDTCCQWCSHRKPGPWRIFFTGDNGIDIEIRFSSFSVHPVDSGGSIIGILTCACLHTAARKCESFIWTAIALLVGVSD